MCLDFPKGVSQAGDPNQVHSFSRTWLLLTVHEQSEFNSQNANGTSWNVFAADEKHLATDVTSGHKDKERVKLVFLFSWFLTPTTSLKMQQSSLIPLPPPLETKHFPHSPLPPPNPSTTHTHPHTLNSTNSQQNKATVSMSQLLN